MIVLPPEIHAIVAKWQRIAREKPSDNMLYHAPTIMAILRDMPTATDDRTPSGVPGHRLVGQVAEETPMFDQDPNEGLIDREEYEKWETMQRTTTVIQAACKDLKKLAFLIETNPGLVIKDTLWFSDVETVADAIIRVSVEIEDLLPNATDDRTPSGVPVNHLVGRSGEL